MRKVFIVHGWGGSPEEKIHKWLKRELEKKDFEVEVPEMPFPESPIIEKWVSHLQKIIKNINEDSYFMGHSIGCQTILRFLEKLPEKIKVGGVVLLAPWTTLSETAYENPKEEKKIARPWLTNPIDWQKVKIHTNKFTCIFSDNDFCVPLSEKEIFRKELNSKIIVEHNKGHFTEESNISKVPSCLKYLLEMTK